MNGTDGAAEGGGSPGSPRNSGEPLKHSVHVWFGRHAICSFQAEPARARAYADAMSRRYSGLRVTVNGRRYRPAPAQRAATSEVAR